MDSLTARETGRQLALGRLDAVDLVEETLARIAACEDPAVFVETLADRARAEAKAAAGRLRAGTPASPLDGVPLAWKDLFDCAGRVTTAGSAVLRDAAPAGADAALVAAGQRAGLVTVGTTNMTEFAYSGIGLNPNYGTPRNPHDAGVARAPGGSSSGSGVAVARGLVPAAIGTDTGGSIRIPAAFNGVVGYKSSTGHYPMEGVFPLSWSLDTLGPLAHDVADCMVVDAVLRGQPVPAVAPVRLADGALSDLDLIVPETVMLDDCQPAVRANFEVTLERLACAGARVRREAVPEFAEILALIAARGHVQLAEALAVHWDRVHGPDAARMDARVVRRLRQGASMSAVDLVLFARERARLIAQTDARFGDALILCPTTPHVAMPMAPLEQNQELFFQWNAKTLRNTMIGNFLDWCGVSIPNGSDGDGLPTGLLISARHGRDASLLGAALAMEDAVRG